MNAFRPATELDEPSMFAGREQQVRLLTDALHVVGSVPLIYGHRGLGKSSLALQMARIAMGDVTLLSHIEASNLGFAESRRFLTLQVTCTDATATQAELLQALINAAESIELVAADDGGHGRQLVDRTTRKKIAFKVFEFESTRRYEEEKGRLSYQELNREEKLVHLCEILTAAYGGPVLFIVDELDRIQNARGIASFLKAVSSSHLKFLLVGIGSNVSELLDDHQSLERRLWPVNVPLMKHNELEQIVSQAEGFLTENDVQISFSDTAKWRLATVAAGFPWFVHVLAQAALISVADEDRKLVDENDVKRAEAELVGNRFGQQFADLYQNAVRDSPAREAVLRAFAHWTDLDIPTREVYRILKNTLGVNNPSAYRGHLAKEVYGGILRTPVFQDRGLVRFRNEMFKAYVRIRPSLYTGLDKRVADAYDALR